jgi:hypothetical protein
MFPSAPQRRDRIVLASADEQRVREQGVLPRAELQRAIADSGGHVCMPIRAADSVLFVARVDRSTTTSR